MIAQLSLFTLIIIGFSIVGLFFLLRCFTLPASFYKNQADREYLLRRKIRTEEREMFIIEEEEGQEGEENGGVTEEVNEG
jgi:hypothetical protein